MMRPGSAFSKGKMKVASSPGESGPKQLVKMPTLAEYVKGRDWVGAIAFLQNERSLNASEDNSKWLAYCCFHVGDYRRAIQVYDELIRRTQKKDYYVYKGCCYFALCQYEEARREALKGPENNLQVRLLFHVAHKKNDEKNLIAYHHKLQEKTQDQLCLAAIHFLRGHSEQAIDIYKKLLLQNRDYQAVNVYVAQCYYKMDYFDISLELLQGYLASDATSIVATNLKACAHYNMYNGKGAEEVLKPLVQAFKGGDIYKDSDLLRHNLVVFRGGQNAMQVLPPLIDVFPEAKLNLVIYHLKNEEVVEAFALIKDLEPNVPREYILKGVALAMYGQQVDSKDHLKTAQQLFQLVGASATECDTIPGRQCMASCFFILKQFDDVIVYLKSIRQFFQNDDDFNWNYGIALASTGEFREAEEVFLLVQNERYRIDECYLKWLARCHIMAGNAKKAWQLYIATEGSTDCLPLLQLIANDCYTMGQFYFSAKAFSSLARLDTDKDYEEALRGAVVGVFQMVVAEKESPENLIEILSLLKNQSASPQTEYIFKVVRNWGKENGLQIEQII